MAVFERQKTRQRRVDPRKLRGEGMRGELVRIVQPRNLLRLGVLVMVLAGALLVMHAPIETKTYAVGDVVTHDIYAKTGFTYIDVAATEQARDVARQETPTVYERETARIERLREEFITLLTAANEAARAAVPASPAPAPANPANPANPTTPPPPGPAPAAEPAAASDTETSADDSSRVVESAAAVAADGAGEDSGLAVAADGAVAGLIATSATDMLVAQAETPPAGGTSPEVVPVAQPETAPAPPVPPVVTVSPARREQLLRDWNIDEALFEELKLVASDPDKREAVVHKFNQFLARVQTFAILSGPDFFSPDTATKGILIWSEGGLEPRQQDSLLNAENTERVRAALSVPFSREFIGQIFSLQMRNRLLTYVVSSIGPTLRPSPERTQQVQQDRAQAVAALTRSFRQGELLVASGAQLTASQQARLQAHDSAVAARIEWWQHVLRVAASVLLAAGLLLVLTGYVVMSERRIAERAARAFVLGAMILTVLVVARFLQPHRPMALFPLTTAAMIVAIAYKRQFAIVCTWGLVLLVVLVTRLGFSDTLLMVVGTSVAIMQLGEIRNRLKLIRVGFVTGLVYFVLVWALMVWSWDAPLTQAILSDTLMRSGLAMASGLLSGFIILGLLPFIERIFNIVTSISLLELCDVNQPALRKLAIEAPGSYSHSLLLGTLVEPAAEAIGANGLLARVGAYFHDIGKANKPHYFTENRNQLGDAPDHDRLTPQMSKIIITGHIKDGLDMARYYGLPKVVQSFIAEHHGTTVIEYFYQEARKGGGGADIPESEFRYAGPKPQRKETAILMMADSCEGAVRSIKEPTPSKIEDKVHEIIMKRLLDGQLHESGLTLNEVYTIEQSLKKSLISVYHGRIAYPSRDERKEVEPRGGRGNGARAEAGAADDTVTGDAGGETAAGGGVEGDDASGGGEDSERRRNGGS